MVELWCVGLFERRVAYVVELWSLGLLKGVMCFMSCGAVGWSSGVLVCSVFSLEFVLRAVLMYAYACVCVCV